MAVVVIDTIKPKNNGTFPVVEAVDVKVTNDKRLDAALNDKANQSDLEALSTTVSGKASQTALNETNATVALKANKSALDATNATVATKANQTDLDTANAAILEKADADDVATSVANLQSQIDNIVTPVTQDAEVENARVGADGTSYNTLKARLDAEKNQSESEISNTNAMMNYNDGQLLSATANLLDWRTVQLFNGYNDGSKLVSSANHRTIILPVSVAYKTPFLTKRFGALGSRFSVATLREDPANGVTTYGTLQSNDAVSITKSVSTEDKYLAIWYIGSTEVANWLDYLKRITVTTGIFEPSAYIEPVENNAEKKAKDYYRSTQMKVSGNLFDKENPMLFWGMNTGSKLSYGNQCCILLPVSESNLKAYTVSRYGAKGMYFSVATLHDEPENDVATYGTTQDNNATSIQIYVRPEDKYIVIFFYTINDTVSLKDIMDGIVILRRYVPATQFIPHWINNNPLYQKKINFFGDSFTDDNTSYEYQLTDRVDINNVHVGKGNSAIVTDVTGAESFLTRVTNLDTTADMTIIFGGINDARDIASGAITLGTIDSAHDRTTFYGGMQLLLDEIVSQMPQQFLLGVIPPSFQPNAPYTTWLPQIQAAERAIYEKYHIPYVDLALNCFAMSDNAAVMAIYRKSVTETTNYHPNALGAAKIADCVQGELERYIH